MLLEFESACVREYKALIGWDWEVLLSSCVCSGYYCLTGVVYSIKGLIVIVFYLCGSVFWL